MRGAGAQCRHNLNYWQFGDYLGIGAGAHGKLTRTTDASTRTARATVSLRVTWRPRRRRSASQKSARSSRRELPFEFCLNALRLVDGFDIGDVRSAHRRCPDRASQSGLRGCA